ncbi:MAG TPA: divalent metal cation transporter [Steroidobacteraceae bacterium]|jgi:NRAMP (natural resistance-associated macrophage protein)-like metal ion transporter|nr:divalent metal cation transporter [Steroidobacteraceae bacterium]
MQHLPVEPSAVVGPSKPRLLGILGPGLITGAADDDPSGIATYSQAGAQFGFQLAWTMLLTFPLMVVIQGISARIGRTTGRGIAANIRSEYSAPLLHGAVLLLLVANICNIGADLGAMAESARLLVPAVSTPVFLIAFGCICAGGQIFLNHTRYVAILKWLTLSLFAYFATLVVVHVSWHDFLQGLLWPHFSWQKEFWLMVVAVLGTTISPYLFFWQASQEVEDTKTEPVREPLRRKPSQGVSALARIKWDTVMGMGISNLVALAIMATTAATFHVKGISQLNSAAQAAEALRPLAGKFAFVLFSLGIIGTGLLAVPVLAGSAAYALGEARRWPVGLSRNPSAAKAFYATIAAATAIGAFANVLHISPLKALVWSAALNAIAAGPVMVLVMRLGASRKLMGQFRVRGAWLALGWCATGLMAIASLAFLISLVTDRQ